MEISGESDKVDVWDDILNSEALLSIWLLINILAKIFSKERLVMDV